MNQQRKKFFYIVVIGRVRSRPSEPLTEMKFPLPTFLTKTDVSKIKISYTMHGVIICRN